MKIDENLEHSVKADIFVMGEPLGGEGDTDLSTVSVPDRTTALCDGLEIILIHHGCSTVVRRCLIDQIMTYLNTSSCEEIWLKRSKYLLAFPNAKYLMKNYNRNKNKRIVTKSDLPQIPDLEFKFQGGPKKWVKNRLNAFSRKNSHLWFSWFQAKRNSLPASDDYVEKTYDDHFKQLTSEDPGNEFAIDAIFSDPTFERVLRKVRREVDSKLARNSLMIMDTDWTPSSSACFEQMRKTGGQMGELKKLTGLMSSVRVIKGAPKGSSEYYLDDDEEFLNPAPPPCLPGIDCEEQCSCVPSEGMRRCESRREWYSYQKNISKWLGTREFNNVLSHTTELYSMRYLSTTYHQRQRFSGVVFEVRVPTGYDLWADLEVHIKKYDYKSTCCCTIQAVLEPFKVRVISKGNALPYYACKPLQKALWESLKDIPCFRLIGRPLSPTDICDLTVKAEKTWEWFSIDYSAATDGLSWRYTSRILRFLLAHQPEETLGLALSVLGPHRLYYPDAGCAVYRGLQTNGQLMGSILSFPILSLANLGTYLVTMRHEQQGWTFKEIINHVLINGDDMVYAGPPELWSKHIQVANDVGLKMSIGKAYHHRTYLNINSTAVHYGLHLESDLPFEIPYLNVGLFFGRHKVQSSVADDHHDEDKGLFANANTLLRGSLPGKGLDVLRQYIALHQKKMLKESEIMLIFPETRTSKIVSRNWFLPISSGGMGIEPPHGWKYYTTPDHRLITGNLIRQQGYPVATQRPIPGFEIEKLQSIGSVPWVKKRMVDEDELIKAGLFGPPRLLIRSNHKVKKCRTRLGVHPYAWNRECFLH